MSYIMTKGIFHLQKILLDNFVPNVSTEYVACMQKIKIGNHAKIRDKNKGVLQLLFPVHAITKCIFNSSVNCVFLHVHQRG